MTINSAHQFWFGFDQSDQAQWNGGGYYGFAQGYEAYGYAPPTQDPNMYYGGFPGYGTYQQPGSYQQPQQVSKFNVSRHFLIFFSIVLVIDNRDMSL